MKSINAAEIIEGIKKKERERSEFINNHSYLYVLMKWVEELGNNRKCVITDMNDMWTEDDDMTFELLRNAAFESYHFRDRITIKYGDIYITLEEHYGQGSARIVTIQHTNSGDYVEFDVVEDFLLNSKRNMRYYSLEVVKRGLHTISAAHGDDYIDIRGELIPLALAWEYLLSNLG